MEKELTFTINLTQLDELEKDVLNEYGNKFWYAYKDLLKIQESTKNLLENINDIVKDVKDRICESCGGSGDENENDPNSRFCKNCKGTGLI